jgi:hypothetical protein
VAQVDLTAFAALGSSREHIQAQPDPPKTDNACEQMGNFPPDQPIENVDDDKPTWGRYAGILTAASRMLMFLRQVK